MRPILKQPPGALARLAGAMPGIRLQRSNEREDMRALTRARGIECELHPRIMLGQISISVRTAASGRQCDKKLDTNFGVSSGTYWWMSSECIRRSAMRADVSVPVVNRQRMPG